AERLVDGIAMLLLATSGLVSFRFGVPALLAVAGLALGAVAMVQARWLVHGVLRLVRRRAHGVAALLETAYDSARELLTWPRLAAAVTVGVLSWGGECVALYIILL